MAFIEVTWQQDYKLINKLIIYATLSIYQPQCIAVSGVKGNGSENLEFLIEALWDMSLFQMVKGQIPVPCARSPDAARTHYLTQTHYAVPLSLCRRTLPLCFTPTPRTLSHVSTRIPGYQHAISSWDGSPAFRWTLDASPSEDSMAIPRCFAVRRLHRLPLLDRRVSLRRLSVVRLSRLQPPPIRNMDELFASGIMLAYPAGQSSIFENCDEILASNVQRINLNWSSFEVRVGWEKYQKKFSFILVDNFTEIN